MATPSKDIEKLAKLAKAAEENNSLANQGVGNNLSATEYAAGLGLGGGIVAKQLGTEVPTDKPLSKLAQQIAQNDAANAAKRVSDLGSNIPTNPLDSARGPSGGSGMPPQPTLQTASEAAIESAEEAAERIRRVNTVNLIGDLTEDQIQQNRINASEARQSAADDAARAAKRKTYDDLVQRNRIKALDARRAAGEAFIESQDEIAKSTRGPSRILANPKLASLANVAKGALSVSPLAVGGLEGAMDFFSKSQYGKRLEELDDLRINNPEEYNRIFKKPLDVVSDDNPDRNKELENILFEYDPISQSQAEDNLRERALYDARIAEEDASSRPLLRFPDGREVEDLGDLGDSIVNFALGEGFKTRSEKKEESDRRFAERRLEDLNLSNEKRAEQEKARLNSLRGTDDMSTEEKIANAPEGFTYNEKLDIYDDMASIAEKERAGYQFAGPTFTGVEPQTPVETPAETPVGTPAERVPEANSPQANFLAAKDRGELTPDKIRQAKQFARSQGLVFDEETGYSQADFVGQQFSGQTLSQYIRGEDSPAGEVADKPLSEFERASQERESRITKNVGFGTAVSDRERRGGTLSMADAVDLAEGDRKKARAMILADRKGIDPVTGKSRFSEPMSEYQRAVIEQRDKEFKSSQELKRSQFDSEKEYRAAQISQGQQRIDAAKAQLDEARAAAKAKGAAQEEKDALDNAERRHDLAISHNKLVKSQEPPTFSAEQMGSAIDSFEDDLNVYYDFKNGVFRDSKRKGPVIKLDDPKYASVVRAIKTYDVGKALIDNYPKKEK